MRNVRDYTTITLTYWVFTLTDGALRMLVLLWLHELGRSPLEIASLFLLYEFFGVVTNFVGGWLGARFGLKSTLFSGLALQVLSFSLLAAQATALSIPIVLLAQGLSGIAKDLTKMSSKSYIKLVVPDSDQRGLMRWVALLTGSKNTLKGAGFFLGGFLLATLGFEQTCQSLAALLALALIISATLLPRAAGRATTKVSLSHVLSNDPRVNWLSAARLFLFGSRDIWFVLALPVFLSSALGFSHSEVGGALALWVIGYGVVQAAAPRLLRQGPVGGPATDGARVGLTTLSLILPLGGIAGALSLGLDPGLSLLVGLTAFGVLFALDSAMHSYLIVAYADRDKVALNVGFYYMANATGRLAGTLLSGVLFQATGQGQRGLIVCLVGSIVFVLASSALCLPLRAAENRAALAKDG
jgi:MFS family permease